MKNFGTKKMLSLMLVLAMLLAGCGGTASSSAPAASTPAASTPAASAPAAPENVNLIWGTASLGGTVQMVATAITTVINKYEPNYKITVQASGGSVENPRLLRDKKIDIAHTTEAVNATRGTGSFAGEAPIQMMTLVKLYGNELVCLVMDKSTLTDTEHLQGLRVCVGPTGSGVSQMATGYLQTMGYDLEKDLKILNLSYNDSVDALKDGTIDVLFGFTSGQMPNSYLNQLQTTATIKALPIKTDILPKLYEAYPDDAPATLPPGSLDCITADYPTFATYSIEFVDNRMSEDVAYTIVKNIYENYEELCVYNKSCTALKLENALDGMSAEIPVHPGAVKYFKEKGVWNDNLKIGTLS